ncbi:hypothetical protein AAFC00_004053 [Neodothiora populina]|uniref:5'-3' DNA helicase ZGRF1-like N-terminal domain-containing protein n=1 Tax=Neodothiora populina TaxID=2781224 RepID=A0ABR3PIE1_9PEZI
MTTSVQRSTPSLSIPQTQNTAPVIEFNCLYTHDLRRKQKRWQDGFLRYHTFNKRAMVYDVPRNFLGDLHWTEGADIQEGDELILEKGGVVVQVAEEVGRTETDLKELLQRTNHANKPSPRSAVQSPGHWTQPSRGVSVAPSNNVTPAKHRSLQSLLGPQRGPIGKASLPGKSPFEERNRDQENRSSESGRASKRQKTDAWNVTRTTKTPKQTTKTAVSATHSNRGKATTKASNNKDASGQRQLSVTEVIDLLSDTDPTPRSPGLHSGPTVEASLATSAQDRGGQNATSPRPDSLDPGILRENRPISSTETSRHFVRGDSPSVHRVQRRETAEAANVAARRHIDRASSVGPAEVPRSNEQSLSRTANTTSDTSDNTRPPADKVPTQTITNSQRQGQALRLVSSAPRRMLVIQSLSSKAGKQRDSRQEVREHSSDPERPSSERGNVATTRRQNKPPEPEAARSEAQSIHRHRLQERLAQIGTSARKSDTDEESSSTRTVEPLKSTSSTSHNLPQPAETAPTTHMFPPPLPMNQSNPQRRPNNGSTRFLHPQAKDDMLTRSRTPSTTVHQPIHRVAPPPRSATNAPMGPPPRPASTNTRQSSGVTTVMLAKPFKAPSAASTEEAMISATEAAEAIAEDDFSESLDVEEEQIGALQEESNSDLGPWSKEAFDLMDWRPPDRELA